MRILYIFVFVAVNNFCFAQGTWIAKANFPSSQRSVPFYFSIGNKGYLGTGSSNNSVATLKDFWQYDPATNVWTQKADFAGGLRWAAVGFSILDKGYAGLGWDSVTNSPTDLWQYDTTANSWSPKANFPGIGRAYPVSFVVNNKGYVGTGISSYSDLWQYDPSLDLWTQKSSMSVGREDACSFSIGNKGYIGVGCSFNDFWEYDALTDTWTQKANFPPGDRCDAAAFSICGKGYIGVGEGSGGYVADLWQYDPVTNQWAQKASFPGTQRDESSFFSIGNKGYIGLGCQTGPPYFHDFYEYTPDSNSLCIQCVPTANFISSDTTFCSEVEQCISFTDLSTCNPTSWHWLFSGATPDTSDQQNPTNICYTNPGTYPVTLIVANLAGRDTLAVTPLIIFANLPLPPTINIIGGDTLISSHGSYYQWYLNGIPIGGATDSFYVAHQGGTYSVQITDNLGCNSLSSGVLINEVFTDPYLSEDFNLFPNPVEESLVISHRSFGRSVAIEIYNVLGENVYSQQLQPPSSIAQTINCKPFPSGIYFVRLVDEKSSYIGKFVKE